MLNTVLLLRAFGVVPAVDGAYQVAGDAADPLKIPALADDDLFALCLVFLYACHDKYPPWFFSREKVASPPFPAGVSR